MVGQRSNSKSLVALPTSAGATAGHHHHHHRSGGYGVNNMSIVGRKLAMTSNNNKKFSQKHSLLASDFTNPNSHTDPNCPKARAEGSNRHNVAIATQVINPSAIGGSLHRRRLVRPFESDDDDESFGGRRSSRFNWNKLVCYGTSIFVVILIMTGVVLAVGYMQSEKQRILSKSARLAQDRNSTLVLMNESVPDSPLNISFDESDGAPSEMSFTFAPNSTSEAPGSTEVSADSIEELQIVGPKEEKRAQEDEPTRAVEHESSEYPEIEDHTNESPNLDLENKNVGNNGDPKKVSDPPQEELHKSPYEVKVLPPKDFNYEGLSFGIPIYNESGKDQTSFTFQVIPQATTTQSSNSDDSFNSEDENDIPVVAKLQTDLFEAGSDSPESEVTYEDSPTVPEPTSNKNKARSENGGNPPKVRILDRSYTPRPNSNKNYPERPKPPRPSGYKPAIKFHTKDETPSSTSPNGGGHEGGGAHISIAEPPNDFKFIPSSLPAPPPPAYAKFEFSNPTPSPSTAHAQPTPTFENYKFDFTTAPSTLAVTLPPTSVDLLFDFQNYAAAQGLDLKSFKNLSPASLAPVGGNTIEVDYSRFTTPSSSSGTVAVNIDPISDSQLSKRTYQYDFQTPFQFDSAGSSSNTNHFAHLLGPQSVTSHIGSASPIGASASLNLYNFDSGAGNNYVGNFGNFDSENTRLAPGTIPLDLASSYIQAGPPGIIYNNNGNNNGGGNTDPSSSFSFNNPLSSPIQSHAGGTTQPNYNTITQGIHLLSLLSGNIPSHLSQPGQDQFASSSIANSNQQDYSAKAEYQIAALTGYGGSSNAFLSGINSGAGNYNPYLIPAESRRVSQEQPAYSADLYQTKTFPDQEGSFSQNIISKLNQAGGKLIPGQESKSLRNGKSMTLSFPVSASPLPKLPDSVEDHGPTLDLLGIRELLNKFIKSGNTLSRKRDGTNSEGSNSQDVQNIKTKSEDLDSAASNMFPSQLKRPRVLPVEDENLDELASPEFGKKLVLKSPSQRSSFATAEKQTTTERIKPEKGLKSGFYI